MEINQVWPEWHEDCVLGEGSFGKVYRAKRVEFGRTFYSAIKVITVPKSQQEIKHARSQGMNDTEVYSYFHGLVENLLNEITLMDNLKGAQNVVGIEDYKVIERQGEIGWDVFIRMELLTPFDSFASNPNFSQKDVIKLGVDICSALEACEKNYIVHRDIKPDNIFISRFGEFKLGDFGIARKLETTQANLSRKGTLNYMAPEVYKSEEYTSNVDIYSLGMVLYALLNNNRIAFLPNYPQPITYKDNEEALGLRLSGAQPPLPCNATASLGQVVLKAIAFDPRMRYQSATEFKNDLLREWNMLLQNGGDGGILQGTIDINGQSSAVLRNHTNSMTDDGTVVYDPNCVGTTVMDESGAYPYGYGQGYEQNPGYYENYQPQAQTGVQEIPISSRSNKFCKIMAYPLAIVMAALGILVMLSNLNDVANHFPQYCLAFGMFAAGTVILLADSNRFAMGLSLAIMSVGTIVINGLMCLDGLSVEYVVGLVSGLLMFFGSIVVFTQKEIRFGGTLCLYIAVIQGLYYGYLMLTTDVGFSFDVVPMIVAMLTMFVWSYGYNSTYRPAGFKKFLYWAAFLPVLLALLLVGVTLVMILLEEITFHGGTIPEVLP